MTQKSKNCNECKQPLRHHFMSSKVIKEFRLFKGRTIISGYYCSPECCTKGKQERQKIQQEIANKEESSRIKGIN